MNNLVQIIEVLEALGCAAALMDREGVVVHANGRLCGMTGFGVKELVGYHVGRFYDEGEMERIREGVRGMGERPDGETYLPVKGGGRVPVVVSRKGLAGDLSDYYIATMIDISVQKEAEGAARSQLELVTELTDTAFEQAIALKRQAEELEKKVAERTEELRRANLDAIYMLAVASEAKDEDTGAHVRRIQELAERLALRLGMGEIEAAGIGLSAVLHDVGKIHVPDHILKKAGKLDEEEMRVMRGHTVAGERILGCGGFFGRARRIARSHHENWDGSGYPDGLSGYDIPIEARIVHVVDVYDALVAERVYKKAWSEGEAVGFIEGRAGEMFDREVGRAFVGMVRGGAGR